MLEVEMKFPVPSFAPLEAKLKAWGAKTDPVRQEVDHYYNAPDRDFAQTDEALRLRQIGTANKVTYKGPKRDATTKTRTEVEVELASGPEAAEAWDHLVRQLHFRLVAEVRKQRQVHHMQREEFELEICLDRVEKVGCFVELEILAPEENMDQARQILEQVAGELNLSGSERRSYLELQLSQSAHASNPDK
jgi:adenylate cyclase class 2